VRTPVGPLSVLAFTTPIPYPFGSERVGYLVKDLDAAVTAVVAAGAGVVVAPFADPIGRDAIVQWSGGVTMQFYWHNVATSAPPLATIPENRVYVSREKADAFVGSFLRFSKGEVISDSRAATGIEIGRPGETFRRVRIASCFGRLTALVTDGHLPFPFGREIYGYEVGDLTETLAKATAAGATMLVDPFTSDGREAAMVQFPGGYIAEIHTVSPP
jgi:predicted enzyme related to lactoylglutathione lyase